MTQSERIIIEQRLLEKESFKSLGRELGKDPTTITKLFTLK
ncbi:MAG: helix-turn-helix domain-containing protein [Clostridia bacterium]|nr:helix-turn-helix domain-containing protein [Clostridia bacterium]